MLAPSSFYPALRAADTAPVWWPTVQQAWRLHWGETLYRQWLQDIQLADWQEPVLTLACPRKLTAEWLEAQSGKTLLQTIQRALPACTDVVITLVDDQPSVPSHVAAAPVALTATSHFLQDLLSSTQTAPVAASPTLNLEPRYTFDSFVVDRSNELAYAAARRVSESDKPLFNPLFIHGGVGLGKTHLLHAMAWSIREHFPDKSVLYLSAEQFMYRFVRALRDKDMMSFKDQCRNVDVLMIDDMQFIAGKESTQEEFFHTFNALIDQKKQIILSADKSPTHMDGIDARLRSRLGWGLVVDVHASTYELRLGILEARAAASNVVVPQNVLEYLAQHITSNIREVEGALHRLIAHAELINRPLSIASAQEILPDLLRGSRRKVTVDRIQACVADHFQIDLSDLLSAKRDRVLVRPRQIAMTLAKQLTTSSLPDLGRAFGGRDHTTVLHAVRKMEQQRQTDTDLSRVLDDLSQAIRYGA